MKQVLSIASLLLFSNFLHAQCEYASLGNISIPTCGSQSFTAQRRGLTNNSLGCLQNSENQFLPGGFIYNAYPNIFELIPNTASVEYNCHAYAWYISEGNTQKFWANFGPEGDSVEPYQIDYITSGCFIEVCSMADADKVLYTTDNHSATIDKSTPGFCISKFGTGPLVRHPVDYTVYAHPERRKYFASTSIAGSTTELCAGQTRTFSVKNIPGATYSWRYNAASLIPLSATNSSHLTVKFGTTGEGWVEVDITTPCSGNSASVPAQATRRLTFPVGAPLPYTSYVASNRPPMVFNDICPAYLTTVTPYVYNNTPCTLTWSWSGGTEEPNWYVSNNNLKFYFTEDDQTAFFALNASNGCGTKTNIYRFRSVTSSNCSGVPLKPVNSVPVSESGPLSVSGIKLTPNPASSQVTITVENQSLEENIITNINQLVIINTNGAIVRKMYFPMGVQIANLDVNGFKPGVYVVRIFDGFKWGNAKLVVR